MHKMLQPSDPATRAILQMEVDQAEARAAEHVKDERRKEQAEKRAAERAEAKAQEAIEVHFANPLPGEWTGRMIQTKLVVIRRMAPILAVDGFEQGHRFEAVEYHGGTRAVTDTAHSELSHRQDMKLLTAWARAWGRDHGIYTPAWVFVPVLEHAGERCYAGVRPSAGMAFAPHRQARVLEAARRLHLEAHRHGRRAEWGRRTCRSPCSDPTPTRSGSSGPTGPPSCPEPCGGTSGSTATSWPTPG